MYNFSKVYLEQIKGSFGTVATLESEDRVTKKETTALAEKQLTEGSFLCHFEDFLKNYKVYFWHFGDKTEKGQRYPGHFEEKTERSTETLQEAQRNHGLTP